MIQTVVKRDGRIVGFNEQKIMAAVRKAMLHTDKGEDERLVQQIADRIGFAGKPQMTVEDIQNQVEMKELLKSYHDKFMKILPATTVFKILKAEDKFHRQLIKGKK